MLKFFLIFLSCISSALFSDLLDVETLALSRTMQYQKNPYDKIIVFSAPRTGSSLVYNVFRFLFEEEYALSFGHHEFRLDRSVLKTHKIPEIELLQQRLEKTLYVITIRDPIQSCLSAYRIRTEPADDIRAACNNLIERQIKYFTFIDQMQKSGYSIAVLRYEDFVSKPISFLSKFIESHFHLSISQTDRNLLEIGYSRENIRANVQSLVDFKEFLPLSGFHGNHVTAKRSAPPPEALYWLLYFAKEAKPLFKKYGY